MTDRQPDQPEQIRVSVCMATYNGANFVHEQLASILSELSDRDEVVVVDDASTDTTVEIVRHFGDPRVRVVINAVNEGHVRAFSSALSLARGEYILLSDQDDLWVEGRVTQMLAALENRPVAAGAFEYFGAASGNTERTLPQAGALAPLRNLVAIFAGRRPYFGSAMGFRREVLPILLPIPATAEAHDIWLAIVGNVLGGVSHVDLIVLRRRIHDGNLTPRRHRAILKIIASRVCMVWLTIEAMRRSRRARIAGGAPANLQ